MSIDYTKETFASNQYGGGVEVSVTHTGPLCIVSWPTGRALKTNIMDYFCSINIKICSVVMRFTTTYPEWTGSKNTLPFPDMLELKNPTLGDQSSGTPAQIMIRCARSHLLNWYTTSQQTELSPSTGLYPDSLTDVYAITTPLC